MNSTLLDEDHTPLVKKWAVCDTNDWEESRLYWNVSIGGWVNLHNERTPPTLFDAHGDARFLMDRLNNSGKTAFLTTIWTDR